MDHIDRRLPSRQAQLVWQIVGDAIFLAWWAGLFRFRDLMPFPSPVTLELAPFWKTVFWPVFAWVASEAAINALELAQPRMVRVLSGLKLIRCLGGIVLAAMVVRADLLVEVIDAPAGMPTMLETWINLGARIAYLITLISLGFRAAHAAWRLIRGAPDASISPA